MDIDGVFSGGGMKAYGLIGAYQVFEEKGLELRNAAGTSAGSIIAALALAGYSGKEMEELFLPLDGGRLLDERFGTNNPLLKWLLLYWRLGLYKGDALEAWIARLLAAKGIITFADLPGGSLRIVASDITNGKIVVLPDELENYGIQGQVYPVAKAVRISCSIPYFFEPVNIGTKRKPIFLVDGGVLSNFPMWLFDRGDKKPIRPVIGVRLNGNKEEIPPREIKNAVSMFRSLFEAMKDAHDNRYISRKHEKNIIFISSDHIPSTEFDLPLEDRLKLVELGRYSAESFLKKWA
ncbi:patatin-like phospholipase family protein [Bacillus testis]|uniref:patatin-like phospholipase family protein n=1 Tax=Bacillus testis TaxID=1622072 RepID=UPI00067F0BB5|nr:patatin-like phospholipase family protein [Bacillus testis]